LDVKVGKTHSHLNFVAKRKSCDHSGIEPQPSSPFTALGHKTEEVSSDTVLTCSQYLLTTSLFGRPQVMQNPHPDDLRKKNGNVRF